ncbi:hypothetical protein FHX75_15199 [Micromonospora palomenae]|uniref:Uncharacterized protein n=1 Tax=Micromonospora palomenae TaxID=1461247 RepID=A0A561VHL6_9ACTN|nr:hypothetical protein FHX75_15199 [Micromonospora palomenae]
MDLYKWSYKLLPLVASELVADCLALAREIRALGMRASPGRPGRLRSARYAGSDDRPGSAARTLAG